MQCFAQACSFSIATLQWHTPVPGLGPELCHNRSHACLGFPRLWHRRCVTVALVSPDEAEQGQSTVPRMVGEAEGVAVVNRR